MLLLLNNCLQMADILAVHNIYSSVFYTILYSILYSILWTYSGGAHSGVKGLVRPETCTVCDLDHYVTFTDFCRVVHRTKPTYS